MHVRYFRFICPSVVVITFIRICSCFSYLILSDHLLLILFFTQYVLYAEDSDLVNYLRHQTMELLVVLDYVYLSILDIGPTEPSTQTAFELGERLDVDRRKKKKKY